jgi:hypothetical protein
MSNKEYNIVVYNIIMVEEEGKEYDNNRLADATHGMNVLNTKLSYDPEDTLGSRMADGFLLTSNSIKMEGSHEDAQSYAHALAERLGEFGD